MLTTSLLLAVTDKLEARWFTPRAWGPEKIQVRFHWFTLPSDSPPSKARLCIKPVPLSAAPDRRPCSLYTTEQAGGLARHERVPAFFQFVADSTPRRADLGKEPGGCGLDLHVHDPGTSWRI